MKNTHMTTEQVGIIDISITLPTFYTSQEELMDVLNLPASKYITKFGCRSVTGCSPHEDPVSLGLTALNNLMKKNNVSPNDVGRLEVGTESNSDAAKCIKSRLMVLFNENPNICGADVVCACYGGTSAVLNAICWLQSTMCSKKYAIVVCVDEGKYTDEKLIPFSGAAGVAILIGRNPTLTFESCDHFFKHSFDFFKPRETFPYPVVNGPESLQCYEEAFENLVKSPKNGEYDFVVAHTPYPYLPEKRCISLKIPLSKLEKSLEWPRKIGNCYTGCVYVALASLLHSKIAMGSKILLFSYGSGFGSSVLRLTKQERNFNDYEIFNERKKINGKEFVELHSKCKKVVEKCDGVAYSGFYIVENLEYVRNYGWIEKK